MLVPWVIRLSEADGVSSPPQKCHWSEDVMLSQQQRRSIWGKALNPSPPQTLHGVYPEQRRRVQGDNRKALVGEAVDVDSTLALV